jgi:DNA-binding response OmpR family regulator
VKTRQYLTGMQILFVEDDHDIRTVIKSALEDGGFDVVEAGVGSEAIRILADTAVDLAIVDLRLPDCNGIDLVRELRKLSSVPIVILTAFGDSYDVVAGLESGADDFLSKPIAPKELVARIRALMRRVDRAPDAPATSFVAGRVTVTPYRHLCEVDGTVLDLTRTEFAILAALMSSAPNTVSKMELLESVWGYDYLGDSRLVDMQIYRLRRKLAERGVADFISTVRGVGFQVQVG